MPLSSISAISGSGLEHARRRLEVSAHNVANVSTEGFEASRALSLENPSGGVRSETRPSGGPAPLVEREGALARLSNTDVAAEVVEQLSAAHAYRANADMISRAAALEEELLDTLG